MAATIRKLQPQNPPKTLEDLIDEAGHLNQQKKALELEYEALREKIAHLMPVPEGEEKVIEEGAEFTAEHGYEATKTVDLQKLYEYDQDMFFRLVKVQVTLAEKTLPKDVFHSLVDIRYGDVPKLKIRKKKEE